MPETHVVTALRAKRAEISGHVHDLERKVARHRAHVELELSIYDKGEYHALAFPCQRDGSGWHTMCAPIAPCRLSRHIGGFGNASACDVSRPNFRG